MLIIVILFTILANLKQLLENSVLEDYGYMKKYDLNFQSAQGSFFFLFVLLYINWLIVDLVWTSINL